MHSQTRAYLLWLWVESVLYVAFPDNPQVSDDLDGSGPQHVVLDVGQRLTGSHHYGLTCVDT